MKKHTALFLVMMAGSILTACSSLAAEPTASPTSRPEFTAAVSEPTEIPFTPTPSPTFEITAEATPDLSWILEAPTAEIEYRIPLTLRHVTDTSAVFQYALTDLVPAQILVWRAADRGDLRQINLPESEAVVEVDGLEPVTNYQAVLLIGEDQGEWPTLQNERWPLLTWKTLPKTVEGMRIAAIGDSGFGDQVTARIADQIAETEADWLLHTGDVVYRVDENPDPPTAYKLKLYDTHQPILSSMPIYPVPGNHEYDLATYWRDRPYYFEAFQAFQAKGVDFPEDSDGGWYAIRHGGVQFLMLNTQTIFGEADEQAQRDWLVERVADPAYRYSIVVLHVPPYSLGRHQAGASIVEARWGDLLIDERIPLILAGHDHNYQRWQIDSTTLVVTGGGSAVLYGLAGSDASYQTGARASHHVIMDFGADQITLQAIDRDGELIDEVEIQVP
ncbi:MAG: metallophosphoesterase family protein [Anaerolineales bacterium]